MYPDRECAAVNRLTKLFIIGVIAAGAGWGEQAQTTGSTQCFAPHRMGRPEAGVAQANQRPANFAQATPAN
jgi:hypothetical protein